MDDEGKANPRPGDVDRPVPVTSILGDDTAFAGYAIEGVAGRGGMGMVYRVRESFPDRVVALKVISPELATEAEFRDRFVRESNLAATIEHPNILPIFRAGDEAGLLYLVMRYVEGTDLAALIADRGRVEPRRAVEIIAQVCAALDAAHRQGLVHRDVKPANVLLTTEDHAYLTDFGIAKRTDATGGPTMTGSFLGTLDYAAPEQIQSGHVDARTDIYATGCMLYHALAGRVPFPADNAAARIYAHLSAEPPSLRDVDPGLAAHLDPVIAKAMAKEPADRYLSAGDLGRAARAALDRQSMTRAERGVAVGAAASLEADLDNAPTVGVDIAGLRHHAHAATPAAAIDGREGNARRRRVLALGAAVSGALLVGVVLIALLGRGGGDDRAQSASSSRGATTATAPPELSTTTALSTTAPTLAPRATRLTAPERFSVFFGAQVDSNSPSRFYATYIDGAGRTASYGAQLSTQPAADVEREVAEKRQVLFAPASEVRRSGSYVCIVGPLASDDPTNNTVCVWPNRGVVFQLLMEGTDVAAVIEIAQAAEARTGFN